MAIGKLDIYREGQVLTTIDIDEQTVFNEKLQGIKSISCDISAAKNIPIQKEDYILFEGEQFTVNVVPEFGKDGGTIAKDYKIVFEAPFYHLLDWFVSKLGMHTFPYYGTAKQHLQLIIDSANANSSGWSLGLVDDTEEFLINYDWHYTRAALDEIATVAKLEYQFTGRTLRMVKSIGRDTGLIFKLGRGQGLHKIQRSTDTSKSSVNRVWGIGGTKNIDASYRGGLEPNLVFNERFVQTEELTAWLNGTGPEVRIKEAKYTNEEMYPQFAGVITQTAIQRDSAGKITSATFVDTTIDFDVNSHIQEGIKAVVSFRTGPLTGVDFEISNFNYATKTTTIIPNTDANGYVLPNDLNFPGVGDKYTFLNMRMPDAYKVTWEAKLRAATLQYLTDNKFDRLIYGVEPDWHFLSQNQIRIRVGDLGIVQDSEMEVNDILRFVDISFPLVNPYKVTAIIGNEIIYDKATKPYADALAIRQQVAGINLTNALQARRNSKNLIELKDFVIDPTTGKYYGDKIAARSIETLYLAIGAVATNFNLKGISFTPNSEGDPNSFAATAGQLVHYDIEIEGAGFVWEMQPFAVSGLTGSSTYYLYAKISKTSLVGSWELSTEVKLAESLPGYYILQAGVLFAVKDGRRDNQLTKGMVFIVGDQITAGRIQSIDLQMFMDLTTGQFRLGDETHGLDWNVTATNRLTLKGSLFQSGSGIVAPVPVYRGVYDPNVTYFEGETVFYNGGTWIYVNPVSGAGHTPADNTFWDVFSQKGTDGGVGSSVDIQYSVNGTSNWHTGFVNGDIFMRQKVGDGAY